MTPEGGQAGASCLSADCGGTPVGSRADDDLSGYCSTCRFWLFMADEEATPGTVVADLADGSRRHFYFNPAEPIVHTGNPELHLGFGGTPYRVRFFDGRVVDTNDLYGQGEIPARFHHLFPPNAALEKLGRYGGDRFDNGPPFHLLVHLEFPAGNPAMGAGTSMASATAAAIDYGRRRNELVFHLARRHGLAGYDPFPPGTARGWPTDLHGNVLVHNHDLGELVSLHDREGTHGPSTHQHDSPAGQERLGPYVRPDAWQLSPDRQARAAAALDAWFDHGPTGTHAPWQAPMTWDQRELESMHAALEAPTIDAALAAFPGAPGSPLSTPEQDAWNRKTMTDLRQALSRAPSAGPPAAEARAAGDAPPDPWAARGTQRRRTARATPRMPRPPRP
jgi:hypothetical protein